MVILHTILPTWQAGRMSFYDQLMLPAIRLLIAVRNCTLHFPAFAL